MYASYKSRAASAIQVDRSATSRAIRARAHNTANIIHGPAAWQKRGYDVREPMNGEQGTTPPQSSPITRGSNAAAAHPNPCPPAVRFPTPRASPHGGASPSESVPSACST